MGIGRSTTAALLAASWLAAGCEIPFGVESRTDGGFLVSCRVNADCRPLACVLGVCAIPSGAFGACDDSEDCGEGLSCAGNLCRAADGERCVADGDCAGVCIQEVCSAPSAAGGACDDTADCRAGSTCIAGVCKLDDGQGCTANSECANVCINSTCAPLSNGGGACDETADCWAGKTCSGGVCLFDDGHGCTLNAECLNVCINATCATVSGSGGACDEFADCAAALTCDAGNCVACASFCDDSNPCTDDACDASGACVTTFNTATCDDGDPCTVPDACAQGVCAGGAVTTAGACGSAPRVIDRSVGVSAGAPLAADAGALTIRGTTAIFAQPLPLNVGVGDVLQYSSTGAVSPDSLAFIHGRVSPSVFTVRDASGATPNATVTSTSSWSVRRAYLSLAAAVNTIGRAPVLGGTENPTLDAALRDFDGFVGGKDLVAANQQWSVACYDDGVDDVLVYLDSPWVTDPAHFVKIYTPVTASEVGLSQRHNGTWGTGYRRTHALQVWERSVWLDGLSLRQDRLLSGPSDTAYDNRVYLFRTGKRGSLMRVSNCFGWMAHTASWNRTFDIFGNLAPIGTLPTTIVVWNSIGLTDDRSAGSGSTAFLANADERLYFYNCTGIATGTASAFLVDDQIAGNTATIVNSLGISASGSAYFVEPAALPFTISDSAASDGSISLTTVNNTPSANNAANQTFTFVDAAGGDYHLSTGAGQNTGVLGRGRSLAADPVQPFGDDIDGQPRPASGWDLGADQAQ